MNSWERFFHAACVKYGAGLNIRGECDRMCDIMRTRDTRMRDMIIEQFQPEDYFEIHDHMIGTGLIGGKACGMLLSRKIVCEQDCRYPLIPGPPKPPPIAEPPPKPPDCGPPKF